MVEEIHGPSGDSGGSLNEGQELAVQIDQKVNIKEDETPGETPGATVTQGKPDAPSTHAAPSQSTTSACVTCKTSNGVVDKDQVKQIKQMI